MKTQEPLILGSGHQPASTSNSNDDEYQGVLLIDTPGTYNYSFRFSDGGYRWTICDLDGAGSNPNLSFDSQQLGVTVN